MRKILLDLFCCAGGTSMGYHRAGFEVVGVDIKPQPHYPFKFYQEDVTKMHWQFWENFAAIHASPPCQKYSMAGRQWRKAGKEYPDLIAIIRDRLKKTGRPYVIENVPGAPLINPIMLNGAMFGMRVRRIRFFECSFKIPLTLIPQDRPGTFRMGRPVKEGDMITPVGHFSNVSYARKEMGIDWMNQGELAQAIPPAYTEWIGKQLMKVIR